jgi:hypothetical protein
VNVDAGFEYAYARLAARLAARPDERLWRQLRSARSLRAAIDAVRGSPAAAYVAGAAMSGAIDDIELALRQHLRARIREAAAWAPAQWRAALRHAEVLIDLPALQHLLSDEPLPGWLRTDPHFAAYAADDRPARRARLAAGPLAPLAAAADAIQRAPARLADKRRRDMLHPLLRAWIERWTASWPPHRGDERAALLQFLRTVQSHVAAFATLPLESTAAARERLAERARRQLHDGAAGPVALFAYLLLVALDSERLRGELVLRAAGRPWVDAEAT